MDLISQRNHDILEKNENKTGAESVSVPAGGTRRLNANSSRMAFPASFRYGRRELSRLGK